MKNKITDPFVVIRTTGNVEPVNRGGNIMFATPVITMNERVSPFVQEFKDEQDALKCTQEMIRELREGSMIIQKRTTNIIILRLHLKLQNPTTRLGTTVAMQKLQSSI